MEDLHKKKKIDFDYFVLNWWQTDQKQEIRVAELQGPVHLSSRMLPYQVKMQHLQILNIIDTSIKCVIYNRYNQHTLLRTTRERKIRIGPNFLT